MWRDQVTRWCGLFPNVTLMRYHLRWSYPISYQTKNQLQNLSSHIQNIYKSTTYINYLYSSLSFPLHSVSTRSSEVLIHLFFPVHMSDHHLAKRLSLSSVNDSGIHSLLIPETSSLPKFCSRLKTHLFKIAFLFPICSTPPPALEVSMVRYEWMWRRARMWKKDAQVQFWWLKFNIWTTRHWTGRIWFRQGLGGFKSWVTEVIFRWSNYDDLAGSTTPMLQNVSNQNCGWQWSS